MINFLRRPPAEISLRKEEWTDDDVNNLDTFVTTGLCPAVEKALRNRIADRSEEALRAVGTPSGMLSKARADELLDLLLEWKNLRDDLQKK